MFGIFYIILIRPQQKRQRELQDWLKSIGKGDEPSPPEDYGLRSRRSRRRVRM